MQARCFSIGDIPVYGNLLLAPMDGITDQPFRRLIRKMGASVSISEFLLPRDILARHPNNAHKLAFTEDERPFGYQLLDNDPSSLASAARNLMDYHPDFIDLNFGCSARSVVHRGAGAALLKSPILLGEIVTAVKSAVACPVTAKIRLGWDESSLNYLETTKILEDSGVALISVHGRTQSQKYVSPASWEPIAEIKSKAGIPIIANGDIFTVEDIGAVESLTGCDGVMIGRAALSNPYLFALKDITTVDFPSVVEWIRIYVLDMVAFYDPRSGIEKSRKVIKRILSNFEIDKHHISSILQVQELSTLERSLISLIPEVQTND